MEEKLITREIIKGVIEKFGLFKTILVLFLLKIKFFRNMFKEKFNNILKTRIEERVDLLCDDLSEIEKDKIKNIMFEKLLIK